MLEPGVTGDSVFKPPVKSATTTPPTATPPFTTHKEEWGDCAKPATTEDCVFLSS